MWRITRKLNKSHRSWDEEVIPLSNQVIPVSQFGNSTASSSFQSSQDESLGEKLDGVILIRIGINGLKPMYGSAIPLIMVQFNGQYHTLIGMIYEVLDREKRRTVGTALKRLEQRGFNQLSLTGAMETIHLVQICMENKENMSGSFWVGLYLDLGEIRLFRSKKRVAARILIHLLSSWPNRTWRI